MSANETRASWRNYRYIAPLLRLRFTLRLFLAGITLLCIGLGIWTHRAREQRRIVEQIKKSGGSVHYDFEVVTMRGQRGKSGVPRVLLDFLGEDYFHEIIEVSILDRKVLVALPRFRKITLLSINSHTLTDEDFAPVAQLRCLKGIDIYGDREDPNTQVGDRSLALLAELPVLELVNVESSRITARGLETLANSRSKSFRKLYVTSPDDSMAEHAADPLRDRFTHVTIRRSVTGGFGKIVADWSGGRPPGPSLPASSP
jgi:hypothetical protein